MEVSVWCRSANSVALEYHMGPELCLRVVRWFLSGIPRFRPTLRLTRFKMREITLTGRKTQIKKETHADTVVAWAYHVLFFVVVFFFQRKILKLESHFFFFFFFENLTELEAGQNQWPWDSHLSRLMTKPTQWHVYPANTQISLGIRPIWSVFSVRMKKAWVLSYPPSAQRRLWSVWADAQADLSLRWAHMPFSWFCHQVAHLFCD